MFFFLFSQRMKKISETKQNKKKKQNKKIGPKKMMC